MLHALLLAKNNKVFRNEIASVIGTLNIHEPIRLRFVQKSKAKQKTLQLEVNWLFINRTS